MRSIIALLFPTLAILFLAACHTKSDEAPPPTGANPSAKTGANSPARTKAAPVLIHEVQWQSRVARVEAVGTSRARQSVTLYPEVSGEVEAVLFKTGEAVEAGQPLVRLDARDQRLAVALAEVELADAERLYSRYKRSEGAGAVTESTLDEAKSAVDRARIALERARVNLTYRTIAAPFRGHVGITDLDVGARVDPSTAVASLDDRSELLVTFTVPELFYGQVVRGQRLDVSTWNSDSARNQGEVIEVDSRVDAQTRSFTVRARVANPEDRLRPGMSFRVQLPLTGGEFPVIPEVALQWGGDGAYVWAVKNGVAERVPATIVQRLPGSILVESNLPTGTPIVTEGIQRLREGQPVFDATGRRVETAQ
jgi:membrane fusion protein (multidrug efflux system)